MNNIKKEEKIIDKEWVINTGACHQCNLEFCDNNYDNCILIKSSEEQTRMDKWITSRCRK